MSHIGTGVVNRPSSIGISGVEEFVFDQGEATVAQGHLKSPDSNTLAIVEGAKVAGSLQASRRAGCQDASTVDDTLDVSRNKPPAIPILRFLLRRTGRRRRRRRRKRLCPGNAQRMAALVGARTPSVSCACTQSQATNAQPNI